MIVTILPFHKQVDLNKRLYHLYNNQRPGMNLIGVLTHWGRNKQVGILQTTIFKMIFWCEISVFSINTELYSQSYI